MLLHLNALPFKKKRSPAQVSHLTMSPNTNSSASQRWEECTASECGERSSVILRLIKRTRNSIKHNAKPVQDAVSTAQGKYGDVQAYVSQTMADTQSVLRDDPRYLVIGTGTFASLLALQRGWFRAFIPLGLATSAIVSHTTYPNYIPALRDEAILAAREKFAEIFSQFSAGEPSKNEKDE